MSEGEHAAEYLRRQGLTVSEHGARCAELVYRFYHGWHHFPGNVGKIDWNNPWFVRWRQMEGLCTYDGNALTRLVFIAHDLGIRVEVNPSMRYLEIVCHPRVFTRTEGRAKPHPTVEGALADWRTRNPARPEPTRPEPTR